MRRRLLVSAALVAAVAAGAVLLAGGSAQSGGYRVDAIFDHARGLIPGQLVEVAGGRVGKISDVSLTEDFKARVSMTVERRFAPFRADATCTIRPQGLIAENYVQCNPGTPDAPLLRSAGGHPPTVPVSRTTEPVNLTDLFEIWNVPTRDRLGVLVSQLGISTAGRGEDINAILRRANPSLALARRVIGLLERQRVQLLGAIDDSDTALVALAPHAPGARRLLRRAASVLTRTGRHSEDLTLAVLRLPALLRGARPALQSLGEVAATGTPLLAQVHRAAPTIVSLTKDAPVLARAARPTLAKLAPVLARGAKIVKRALPVSRALRIYAHRSLPSAKLAGTLLPNLSKRGFVDNLMRFFYYATLATARFDETSHILPAHVGSSMCANYASDPMAGCSANYDQPAAARGAKARSRRERSTERLLDYLLG